MTEHTLEGTARALVAPGKGILAADESFPTIGKRFAALGIENSEPVRRSYREMLLMAPGAEEFISGAILFDETLRQKTAAGMPFAEAMLERGILPGIKVDAGAHALALHAGEMITDGLDGLRGRLAEYRALGARFAKWRAVINITASLPSRGCMQANAHALARYAALCQEANIVPIVEPEVLMDGDHTIERCEVVTSAILHEVFQALADQRVVLEGILLKPNMVVSGIACASQADIAEVARRTVQTLLRHVPAAVPGVVFLSGGQADVLATAHLNAMNQLDGNLPWELSYSYGRALQQSALAAWAGKPEQFAAGQRAFVHRAKANSAARSGKWDEKIMEKAG